LYRKIWISGCGIQISRIFDKTNNNKKHPNENMFRQILIFFLPLWIYFPGVLGSGPIRVTCIGDSITEGGGCQTHGYVPVLQEYLGSGYNFTNAGKSSMTMLKQGLCNDLSPCSYWDTEAWEIAMNSRPQIVTIMLGTNDAKYYNWEGIQQDKGDYFALDYVDMINRLNKLKPRPQIFLMVPPPLFQPVFDMNQTIINTIFPVLVRDIASVMSIPTIDLYSALLEAYDGVNSTVLECDGCHPTDMGNDIIAKTMFPYIVSAGKTIQEV
jgi:acyl-CoA thioesterase-1